MSDLSLSGKEKKMSIVLHAEGYADVTTEWLVPEELVRPYAMAYNAGIAALGLEISKAIYEKLLESGMENAETFMARTLITATDKSE